MKQYYYLVGSQQFGPFSLDELRQKAISRNTKVWTQGLADWMSADTVPELSDWFTGTSAAQAHLATSAPVAGSDNPSDRPPEPYRTGPIQAEPIQADPRPKTWLVEAILVTLFCCMPFGIAGIVNASNVDARYSNGDFAGANRASAEAGKWTKIGFFVGLGWVLLSVIYFILMFVGVLTGFGSYDQ